MFLLQWTGLRRGLKPEDLIWGLFMNKYIFPGADASLCPGAMLKAMEKAGWETHSVENISIHYSWTIERWHDNWISNKDAILAAYGERWFRIWNFFLAWSALIGEQVSRVLPGRSQQEHRYLRPHPLRSRKGCVRRPLHFGNVPRSGSRGSLTLGKWNKKAEGRKFRKFSNFLIRFRPFAFL